jgi:hypothetical protein
MQKTYIYGAYRLELDSDEIIANDPGAGTPALVYGPDKQTATFWCALSSGELGDGTEIPAPVMKWLDRMTETVDNFLTENGG